MGLEWFEGSGTIRILLRCLCGANLSATFESVGEFSPRGSVRKTSWLPTPSVSAQLCCAVAVDKVLTNGGAGAVPPVGSSLTNCLAGRLFLQLLSRRE